MGKKPIIRPLSENFNFDRVFLILRKEAINLKKWIRWLENLSTFRKVLNSLRNVNELIYNTQILL